MEKKINIAELLKDCPKGMELDCTIYENLVFNEVDLEAHDYPIVAILPDGVQKWFTSDGRYELNPNGKCVIFPKGKTTWEGFQRPFKDGDIITCTNRVGSFVSIYKEKASDTLFKSYAHTSICKHPLLKINSDASDYFNPRFATKEEKEKLFQVIKDNGYKWNAETKTLEKLIEPKFKVGDKITEIGGSRKGEILYIDVDKYHVAVSNIIGIDVFFEDQDGWELVSNKFDITTLKPFDKVLVKDCYDKDAVWECDFFSHVRDNEDFVTVGGVWKYCIPYEMNKELLGTADDCDDYYKTWKF